MDIANSSVRKKIIVMDIANSSVRGSFIVLPSKLFQKQACVEPYIYLDTILLQKVHCSF
jgi:hypothetical protein